MDTAKAEIAATAARLVVEEGLEYAQAKRRAVKQLGLPTRTALPDNDAAFSGSLIVADFASLDEAEAWAQQDPYVDAGVYAEILIRPFKKVLPA